MKRKIFAAVTAVLVCVNMTSAFAIAPKIERGVSWFSETQVVKMDRTRTRADIARMAKELKHSGFNSAYETRYETAPSFSAPYVAGSLNKEDVADALNALKMIRYIAGLPYENIKFTDELNDLAQHGSVLLAASNQFSHSPVKPADMDDEFYRKGKRGCSEANISAGRRNISAAVIGYAADSGAGNIQNVGHRRWLLKPGGENFGIGFARNPLANYRGYRVNMHVFDGLNYWGCESDSFIAWPSSGDFPIQYFAASENIGRKIEHAWSVNLGKPYAEPSKEKAVVTLTRESDGKRWVFDKNTPNLGEEGLSDEKLHFAVDNDGYGMEKAIVFRPDMNSLGTIQDGEVFNVNISGINYTDGSEAALSYDICFFDLEKEMEKNPDETPAPSSAPTSEPTISPAPSQTPSPTPQIKEGCEIIASDGKVSIWNYGDKMLSGTVYAALYNSDTDLLEGIDAIEVNIEAGSEKAYGIPVYKGYYVKVFLWDGVKPLCDSVRLE